MDKYWTLVHYHTSCDSDYCYGHGIVAGLLASNMIFSYEQYIKECKMQGIVSYRKEIWDNYLLGLGDKTLADIFRESLDYLSGAKAFDWLNLLDGTEQGAEKFRNLLFVNIQYNDWKEEKAVTHLTRVMRFINHSVNPPQ